MHTFFDYFYMKKGIKDTKEIRRCNVLCCDIGFTELGDAGSVCDANYAVL